MKKTLTTTILSTEASSSAMIIRLMLGIVLFAHGAQNMMGWFGGPGFTNTMYYLTTMMNLPYVLAFLVIALQFFGALLLILGVAVRPIALAVGIMFVGMIVTVHLPHGFFMNWFGTAEGEGYEYHLLVLACCASAVVTGAGSLSVDRKIYQQFNA